MWFCCLQRINLKRSGGIHFQPTAISRRRVSKHCGRANASSGRKPKQQPAHVQLHFNQIILLVSPFIHCLQELSEQGGQDTHSKNLLKKVFNLMTNVISKYLTVGLRVSITGLFCWSIFYETQGLDPRIMSEILLWDWTHQSHGIHTMKPSSAVVRNLQTGHWYKPADILIRVSGNLWSHCWGQS